MRVTFFNYDRKGDRVASALTAAGHQLVDAGGELAVIDHDIRNNICDAHDKVVLYPHGGNPVMDWDGINPVHPHTRLQLTHSQGHADVLRGAGYPARCEPVGWCYSDIAEPRYPHKVRRILFAPEHPGGNGYLAPEMHQLNARILGQLNDLDADVKVRHWYPGGNLDHTDIDNADVVIAVGTMAYLAAARGTPLLMFGSDLTPDMGADAPAYPTRWAEYQHLMRYPLDFDDADFDDLLATVTRPNEKVEDWRNRFIQPFDPHRVVELIEAA